MAKKVILAVAHQGYQSIEYGITAEVLKSSGVTVYTASDEPEVAVAKDGSTTVVDLTLDQINPLLYDGLFLIGGPGALECLDNTIVHTLLQQMMALKKAYGAICIAPRILAKAEVLGGKHATGWDGDNKLESIFLQHAVLYQHKAVVIDGTTVTATDPHAAQDFAHAILHVLGILPA